MGGRCIGQARGGSSYDEPIRPDNRYGRFYGQVPGSIVRYKREPVRVLLRKQIVDIGPANGGTGLFIGPRPLGELLCARIDEFRLKLQTDAAARECFRRAYERENMTKGSTTETVAWRRLVAGR